MHMSKDRQRNLADASEGTLLAMSGILEGLYKVVSEDRTPGKSAASTGSQILQFVSAASLSGGWAGAALVSGGTFKQAGAYVLGLLIIGALGVTVLAIGSAFGIVREWRTMEADMVGSVGRNMSVWYEKVCRIRATYPVDQLTFAHQYITSVANQARRRVSFFIGAIEKVGAIPLVASTVVALMKFSESGAIPIVWCTARQSRGFSTCLRCISWTSPSC